MQKGLLGSACLRICSTKLPHADLFFCVILYNYCVEMFYVINSSQILQMKLIASSSYNPLPRAAGKIQYEAKAKPKPSNCILPES